MGVVRWYHVESGDYDWIVGASSPMNAKVLVNERSKHPISFLEVSKASERFLRNCHRQKLGKPTLGRIIFIQQKEYGTDKLG